jgi:hypothetical protein
VSPCAESACGAMDERRLFWLDKNRWPRRDPSGLVFLARAFDELGRARFGPKWTGSEGGAGPRPNVTMLVCEKSRSEFVRELRRQRGRGRALLNEHPELRSRCEAIQNEIADACERGKLASAWREVDGGDTLSLKPSMWSTDNLDARFYRCQMSFSKPFGDETGGEGYGWIFIDRASLDRLLGLPSAYVTGSAPPIGEVSSVRTAETGPLQCVPANSASTTGTAGPERIDQEEPGQSTRPVSEAELRRQMTAYLRMFQDVYPPPDRDHAVVHIREACPNNFVAVKRVHRLRAEMAPAEWKESGRRARVESGG